MCSLAFASSRAMQLLGFAHTLLGLVFSSGALLHVSQSRQMRLSAVWKLLSQSGEQSRGALGYQNAVMHCVVYCLLYMFTKTLLT